jgi:transposase
VKLFTNFQLSDRIPEANFYHRLKDTLDLSFLYDLTKEYYGYCGQKSIDPIVFYKLCLVGYLENIINDCKLIDHCNMRLDILYFIGHKNDEHPTFRVNSFFSCTPVKSTDLEHKKTGNFRKKTKNSGSVPQVGIEPTRLTAHEFESCASTSSATAAFGTSASLSRLDCEFIIIF